MKYGTPPCKNRSRRHSLAHYLFVWCLVCCAIFLWETPAQAQGSQGYQYSQTITLSHTQVPNTDQTDFPVLISGTYPYLATVANGGQVTNSNGYDIIFTSDAAGTTQLDHEIDSYNPANGTINFWVRIPTLSHTTDTVIYLFYGNPNITTSQENKAGVWQNNYTGVWHCSNALDSLGANNGTASSGVSFQTSPIGEAATFAGNASSYTSFPNVMSLSPSSTLTESVWVNAAGVPVSSREDAELGSSSKYGQFGFSFQLNGSSFSAGPAQAGVADQLITGAAAITAGSWHRLTLVLNSGSFSFYQDGVQIGSQAYNSTTNSASANTGGWGLGEVTYQGTPYFPFNGAVDDVTLSSVVRSSDWIATEYANQSAPWNFYTFGGLPTPVISSISPTSGRPGTQVTIQGSNFGSSQGSSSVTFNGVPASSIVSWSNTQIVAVTPSTVTTGPVLVIENPTTSNNNVVFTAITASVTYVGTDTTTQGSWHGTYGNDGYSVAQDSQSLPGYATFSPQNQLNWTWATNPTDPRALQTGTDSGTIAACWYSNPEFNFDVNFTDGNTHQFALYALDWDSQGRTETIQVVDVSSSTVLDTRNISSFNNGVYLVWNISGHVKINVTLTGGPNAVISGAFFDPAGGSSGSAPRVYGVSPSSGPAGIQVTIAGVNFGPAQGNSSVTFNGVPAGIASWSNGQVVAVTPATVSTGPVVVAVNSVSSNNNVVYTAYNPIISNLSPSAGTFGASITINGTGFGVNQGSSYVSFDGSPVNLLSWSNTSIQAVVPGLANGPATVTVTVQGVTSNGITFTIEGPPSISAISPTSGTGGTLVTINGSGFGSVQSNSTVAFNGLPAVVNSWSDTQIIAAVPETSTGPVSVTIGGVAGNGPTFTLTTVAVLTNSQGNQTTYTSTMVGGVWVLLSAQGPGCSTCSVRNNQVNTYDSNGNLLTRTDANGNTITYTYDSNNNVLSKSAQLNGTAVTTSYTYNSFGEVLTVTDPLGNTTTNTYDAHGNLTSVTSPAPNGQSSGGVTQFAYNGLGELTQITDPLGHSTTFTYYSTGLVQTLTDAQNNTTSYTYDSRGNRTSVIDPINGSAHPTTFSYDVMNRLLGITYPNGTSVTFAYDYRGRRVSATDQNNHTSTFAYDDADRLLSITDPANNFTQLGYDTEGNITSVTDANNHTTSFTYDAFGRVIQTTFPSSLIETYGYDAVGNVISKTDRKGQTIQYVYDALYRLTNKIYPDSTNANYVYDLVGKIRQVTDPSGSYGFAYDNMGRLIGAVTQYSFLPGYNLQNSYAYDAASNRTSMTAPDGSTNTYNYDTLNRLSTLTSSLTGQFGFSYDALSRRTQLNRPNGVITNYSYDAVSNLLSILHQTGSTTFDGSSYGYDNARNRTSNTNYLSTSTSNYGYDAIYELLSASGTGESYTYDTVGNRLSSANVSSCSYNSSNQLVSSSLGSYTYDANGNTLSDPSGKQYTWDFENRLTQVVVPGTGTVGFKYDPFGRRIYKSSPSFVGAFAYDGFNLIQTMNSAGSVLARYTMTQNIDEPLAMQRSSSSTYYEADGLGSITSLTSSTGSVANTYTYDSFGNITNLTGTLRNPFLYSGREYDNETSLYFNRARYYSPVEGRFISEDPIRFRGSGTDFYANVRNNPVNLTDPLGLCTKKTNLQCLKSAVQANAIPIIADFAGTIPGEGQVLTVAQYLAGGAGIAYSLATVNNENRNMNAASAVGGIVTMLFPVINAGLEQAELSRGALQVLPVIGNVYSGLNYINDVYQMGNDYYKCLLQNMN